MNKENNSVSIHVSENIHHNKKYSKYRDKSAWSKRYNAKPEVKLRKALYYQANKKRLNDLQRKKRQLVKKNKITIKKTKKDER